MGKYEKLVKVPGKGNFYLSELSNEHIKVKYFKEGSFLCDKELIGSIVKEQQRCFVYTTECVIVIDLETLSKLTENSQC